MATPPSSGRQFGATVGLLNDTCFLSLPFDLTLAYLPLRKTAPTVVKIMIRERMVRAWLSIKTIHDIQPCACIRSHRLTEHTPADIDVR